MLTDRAQAGAEVLGPWILLAAYGCMAYALAQHVGWLDAVALVLAFGQVVRAVRGRAPEIRSEER